MTNSISSRLDEAMKAARFKSQNTLAKSSGVPQATISRILKGGGKKGPETDTLRKLAAACGVAFEWLNEGIGPMHRAERRSADVHHLPGAVRPPSEAEINHAAEGMADQLADDLVELLLLYQQADAKGRKFILRSARAADKRGIAARWVRADKA